ncbi:hypothetical protein V502_04627 [Pseudogymnoascus sp. VKM F-4520 (FW-2644)]|nr:hypothetical protein V502_04627 [Pseudogymnoascus sp. VKM F-4520 (FW-2644)]
MASPPPTALDAKLEILKNQVYEQCLDEEPDTVFRQQDILDMGVIPDSDAALLLAVTQRLVDEKLFKMVRDGQLGWMYRPLEDALKYRGLTHEQEMVYSLIDESSTEGIWSKTIKNKTALHESLMRSALKALETKRLISDMKSVEHPTRKMYIKSTLRPSEKATGGAWYTDNELDEAFIEGLTGVLYKYIEARSFYRSTSRRPLKRIAGRPAPKQAQGGESITLLPLPPTYRGYPSLAELTLFIESSPITSTTLSADDISALLDVLIYDRRIEQVVAGPEGVAFKAVRKAIVGDESVERGNGVTEAPCGRCPVFELCEEGGPVSASSCVYFQEWLTGGGF